MQLGECLHFKLNEKVETKLNNYIYYNYTRKCVYWDLYNIFSMLCRWNNNAIG